MTSYHRPSSWNPRLTCASAPNSESSAPGEQRGVAEPYGAFGERGEQPARDVVHGARLRAQQGGDVAGQAVEGGRGGGGEGVARPAHGAQQPDRPHGLVEPLRLDAAGPGGLAVGRVVAVAAGVAADDAFELVAGGARAGQAQQQGGALGLRGGGVVRDGAPGAVPRLARVDLAAAGARVPVGRGGVVAQGRAVGVAEVVVGPGGRPVRAGQRQARPVPEVGLQGAEHAGGPRRVRDPPPHRRPVRLVRARHVHFPASQRR
ncbi:hypothetical protein ACBI99_22255 [Nonomuraea sp. ATR24]|uniref:hypothetical protein n=1 Tax=Nonomuraea sp. ATR24 TaxID=1676744 RepID=UPI0035BFB2B0